MDDNQKTQFASECAFTELLRAAIKRGMKLEPAMGLMYLPDQAVTRQFQEACRAVIQSLAVPAEVPEGS
jgi:hypothetical protein